MPPKIMMTYQHNIICYLDAREKFKITGEHSLLLF
jgi:hypothetical protein